MRREAIFLRPIFFCLASIVRRMIKLIDPYGRTSYAQEGEDLLLERIFSAQSQGFYVDVGAHHPLRFSNTYLLYKRGWRGINIDAMPGSMKVFNKLRPLDINVESAVALENAQFTYHVFKEKALNTCDNELAAQYISGGHKVVSSFHMNAEPLANLLTKHVPVGQRIDLLSVDVEGLDLDVLKSNDWQRFRPRVLITEELRTPAGTLDKSTHDFLIEHSYREFARTYNSVFYVADEETI
jgi:FkbM family methyltransferase